MKLSEIARNLARNPRFAGQNSWSKFPARPKPGALDRGSGRTEPDDFVVEIGPGLGALTEFLARAPARVLALEKDGRLAEFLARPLAP